MCAKWRCVTAIVMRRNKWQGNDVLQNWAKASRKRTVLRYVTSRHVTAIIICPWRIVIGYERPLGLVMNVMLKWGSWPSLVNSFACFIHLSQSFVTVREFNDGSHRDASERKSSNPCDLRSISRNGPMHIRLFEFRGSDTASGMFLNPFPALVDKCMMLACVRQSNHVFKPKPFLQKKSRKKSEKGMS